MIQKLWVHDGDTGKEWKEKNKAVKQKTVRVISGLGVFTFPSSIC